MKLLPTLGDYLFCSAQVKGQFIGPEADYFRNGTVMRKYLENPEFRLE
jgi:hypothetical protein